VTAAELLKKHGYQTARSSEPSFSIAIARPRLDRGFDFYDNFPKTDSRSADGRNDGRWGRVERRGMEVVEQLRPGSTSTARDLTSSWVTFTIRTTLRTAPPFSEKYKDHLYDGEIAYAIHNRSLDCISQESRCLRQRHHRSPGDHGEGLGEHGEETHGLFLSTRRSTSR